MVGTDPGLTPEATVDPIPHSVSVIPLFAYVSSAASIVRLEDWKVAAAIAATDSQSFAQPFLARLGPDRQFFVVVGQRH